MLKHQYVMNFVNSVINEKNIVSRYDVPGELLSNHTHLSWFVLVFFLGEPFNGITYHFTPLMRQKASFDMYLVKLA